MQFLFIKKFRSIENQGVNLSNKYFIDFTPVEGKIRMKENPFYIKGFYGESISCLNGIIGENGVGKTTVLNYIKEVLAFPMSSNPNYLDCILVFYNEDKNLVLITSLGFKIERSNCELPEGLNVIFVNLEDLLLKKNKGRDSRSNITILSLIKEYSRTIILYLSNVFDGRSETDYGPQIPPYTINLSVNYLVQNSNLNPERSTNYKQNEIHKNIKLVLNSAGILPTIKLPQFINVNIKNILIDEYFWIDSPRNKNRTEKNIYKEKISAVLNQLRADKVLQKNKRIRIQFWLCSYLLIQISNYYDNRKLAELMRVLKTCTVKNMQKVILSFLLSHTNYLKLVSKDKRFDLQKAFKWSKFIHDYELFINSTLESFDKDNNNNNEYNSIRIPLTKDTENRINELMSLSERSMIELNLLYFTWHDMSTGEVMLLRFFSNLYFFSQSLKTPKSKYQSLLFLFDELETFYHPQWQKRIIKTMLDFINHYFRGFKVQIIFTSHSPITISDIPKTDLTFFKLECGKILVQKHLSDHKQTFAANVHSLLTDSFFLQEGLIGDFANEKINEIINMLYSEKLSEIIEKREYIESIINIVGEPVIKAKLIELLENRLKANLITIKKDIQEIQRR